MTVVLDLDKELDLMPTTEIEEVLQNVRMIVGTWRSEVALDREFGIDADIIDAPIGQVKALLTAELTSTINRCEPRARLKSVTWRGDVSGGVLEPMLTLEIEE